MLWVIDGVGLGAEACLNDSVTVVAELSVELVVVLGTVGEPGPLVVLGAQERFLTFGADKVLNTVEFSQGGDDPVLYRSPAGSTDGQVQLVVAPETAQPADFVGSEAWPGLHLPGGAGQLRPALRAGEMVRVEGLALTGEAHSLLVFKCQS